MELSRKRIRGLHTPGLATLDDVDLRPLFDLDFMAAVGFQNSTSTPGIQCNHVHAPSAPTAARASSALFFQNPDATLASQLAATALYGTNILRYGNNAYSQPVTTEVQQPFLGLLVEGADQNVVLQNTQYAAINWTLAGCTCADSTDVGLYDNRSFLLTGGGGEGYIYQTALLTAEDYILCFFLYYPTGTPSDSNVRVAAGVSGAIAGIASTFEQVQDGLWLVWASFTATAANWDIGVNVRALQERYISLISCYKAAPTNEGGAFPRSPIPSGAAATTRAAGSFQYPGTSNMGLTGGTWDVEFAAPCAESAIAAARLDIIGYYVDGNNYMYISLDAGAGNHAKLTLKAGGGSIRTAAGNMAYARNDILKLRAIWSTSLLDGVNYAILYGRIGTAAWAQIGTNNGAFGGALTGGQPIYIGSSQSATQHLAAPIRRVRTYNYPIVGTPGW